jgi:hypothetical protein
VKFRGVIVVAALLSACSNSASSSATTSDTSAHSGPCPETIVIHANEMPMADVGFLYQLLSTDYVIDPEEQSITAPLATGNMALDSSQLEIRHGVQVSNYEQVSSILHSDDTILLGLVDTDESIAFANSYPTRALFAPFQISPDIIYWNPDLYPTASRIADHNSWDIRVMYADGAYFMRYLLATQQLKTPQPVNTFDGTPIPFIASGGMFLQQGLSTVDPYAYRYIYRDWMKDIAYQYIHESGWQPYAMSVSATPEQLSRYEQCLRLFVPVLQQATKDFFSTPEPAVARIVDASRQFDTTWSYSPEQARAALEIITSDGLIGNGSDNVLGSFDTQRIEDFLDSFRQAFPDVSTSNVTAEQLFTNDYLDASMSFGE